MLCNHIEQAWPLVSLCRCAADMVRSLIRWTIMQSQQSGRLECCLTDETPWLYQGLHATICIRHALAANNCSSPAGTKFLAEDHDTLLGIEASVACAQTQRLQEQRAHRVPYALW